MTVYAITDTKKGEQGLRLLIFKLGPEQPEWPEQLLVTPFPILSSAKYTNVSPVSFVTTTAVIV